MSKWIPDRKVWGGGSTAIVAWLLVQLLQTYAGVALPPGSDATLAALLGFVVAYLLPPAAQDVVKRVDGQIIDLIAKDPTIPLVAVKNGAVTSTSVLPTSAGKVATTTVVNGMTGKVLSIALALLLLVPLAACNTTKATTEPGALQQAVADAKNMTPEQKYAVACNTADGLILAYRAFLAEKQSATTNARVEAAYAAVQPFCVTRPENYATALIALVQGLNAFKAAMPKAA